MPLLFALLLSPLLFFPLQAAAQTSNWQSLHEHSRLQLFVAFEGVPVGGQFEQFEVSAALDESGQPDSLLVVIDTGSATFFNRDIDSEIKKPDWFSVAHHPQARFSATQIVPAANGFTLRGVLLLKGNEQPVVLPLAWSRDAQNNIRLRGETTLMRNDFAIGLGEWSAGTMIGHAVTVRFDVLLGEAGDGDAGNP